MAQLNLNLPDLSILSLETRPEYVDISELEFISRVLSEADTPTQLEIFIGLNTEGLALEGGSSIREGEDELVTLLEQFNRSQDYDILDRIMG